MKRQRKETEQEGNSEKTDNSFRLDVGEPRNHDDQGFPLSRVIGRAHLKPLMVTRTSGDVEIFDRFILQLLRAKGIIARDPEGLHKILPVVGLMPYRPMFIGSSSVRQPTPDGVRRIFQISPASVRTYIQDLLTQPVLLETFVSRGRELGLAEVRPSVLHSELLRMVQLLDLAAAEDRAILEWEEKHTVKEMQRKRCAAARKAAKMRDAVPGPSAAAAGDAAMGGEDDSDDCLPRCEELIVIGIGLGMGASRRKCRDLGKRISSEDQLRGRGKDGKTDGAKEAVEEGGRRGTEEEGAGEGGGEGRGRESGGREGEGEGGGEGEGQEGGGGEIDRPFDVLLRVAKGEGEKKKKKEKKSKKKKQKKPGKGKGVDREEGDEEGEEEEEEEEDEDEKVESFASGYDDDYGSDLDTDSIGSDIEEEAYWEEKGRKEESPVSEHPPSPGRPTPSLVSYGLPKEPLIRRSSMYSLQFTPAFVFSYFQTMPPHYSDDVQLLQLFERFLAKTRLKKTIPIGRD